MANDFFAEIEAWVRIAKAKPDYTELISDRKGEPDNQKLYDQVKADAQKKFDVYPSAVANGWVVQEYKRRGGTYSKPVAKGDLPGHEFRGNQYTEGTGKLSGRADDVADRANDEGASKSIAAEHKSIAEGHKSIAMELADQAAEMPLTQAEKPLVAKAAIDNFKAFIAHANAADAHEEAAKALANDPHSESALDAVEAAQRTSDDAATASAEAHGGTSIAANLMSADAAAAEEETNKLPQTAGSRAAQITSEAQTAPLNAAGAAKDLATKANDLYEKNQIDKFDKTMPASVASKIGKDHWDMAIEHQKEAERLSNEDETHLNSEIGHADASDEHYNAAKRWGVVAGMLNGSYGPSQLNVDSAIAAAKEASGSATDASSNIIPEAAHEDTIAQNGGPNVAKPLYGFSVKNAGNIKSDVEASYIASALHEHLVMGAGHPDDTEVRTPADYKVGASQHYQLAQYYAGKAQSGPQKAEYRKAADAHIAAYKACEKAASAGTKEPSKASVAAVADAARVADRASFNLGETYMNNRK